MKFFNKLFGDDRAVSPVIGVVLMVAVVVILAAVIGAFVLGLGGEQQDAPQAAFSYDAETGFVTMQSGEAIPSDQLTVEGGATFTGSGDGGTVVAGDASGAASDANSDGQIDVIWTSPDGGDSAVLTSFNVGGGGGGDT